MGLFDRSKLKRLQELEAPVAGRPRVLLVDDETSNLAALRGILESYFEVTCAASADEAMQQADAAGEWAAIVSDYRMPVTNGVQLLERLAARMPRARRILLTGYVDIDSVIDSINRAQIWKFMVKPYDRDDLRITVQRAVEAYQMQCQLDQHVTELEAQVAERTAQLAQRNRDLEAAFAEIHRASRTDPLTQVKNRRYFEDTIDADLALASGSERDLVFFMLDIDHFKTVNDTHGHAAGDELLRQFAQRLSACARPGDVLLRWGGEEFVLLARFLHRGEASAYAERLRACVSDRPFALAAVVLSVTCSVGFAACPVLGEQTISWELALQLADLAMYQSKHHGRNAWAGVNDAAGLDADGLLARLKSDAAEQVLLCSWRSAPANADRVACDA